MYPNLSEYGAIYVDPPWSSKDFGSGIESFQDWPYSKMRLKDIAALPVPDLAAEKGHLWLWAVNSTLPHACWLQQQWGFMHMNVITWVKPSGFGYWWANCTEHLLFAYKDKLRMKAKLKPTVIFESRREHSRKPEQAYQLIEQISQGPYLEMFARYKRPGWDSWGDEVEGVDIYAKQGN